MNQLRDDIDVLHVDDDAQLVELAATFVERHGDGLAVETTTDPEEALALATERSFDCVVSDYQMPRMDGLELFEALRDRGVDVPFVLFTGRGSEEIASEAISMGVTEYLQKESGTEQYEVLANRIWNVVSQHRATVRMKRGYRALDAAPVGVLLAETGRDDSPVVYANRTFQELTGCDRRRILGRSFDALEEAADATEAVRRIREAIERREPISAERIRLRKNGSARETRVDVSPIANGSTDVTHVVGFLTPLDGSPGGHANEIR